jgi:hypothetical protein
MIPLTAPTRSNLGLFPDRPPPRLDDRVIELLRVRHDSRRTEQPAGFNRGVGVHCGRHSRPYGKFTNMLCHICGVRIGTRGWLPVQLSDEDP